ncbi:heterokaryon incompatibility protein-domain-containing protein [Xylariales sp. PMI_506]|nr:heterokaryon incompatibility protein-domain-containing protein [Xylariales sp. PMI_506]
MMIYDDLTSLDDSDGPYIRLLTLFPELPIRCQLTTYPLNNAPEYEALSYVWGQQTKRQFVVCNNSDIAITLNLADALLRLRDPDSPKLLWVDSICINQRNVMERIQQVLIMRNIYERAKRVAVFLGPLDKDGAILSSLLPRLASEIAQSDGRSPKLGRFEFWALMNVLNQPWWNRIWVVQEVLVGREVVVWVGKECVPWSTLIEAFYFVAQVTPTSSPHTVDGFSLKTHKHMMNLVNITEMRKEMDASRSDATPITSCEQKFSLLGLLQEFRGFDATDPRDKVYGLLGLASTLMPDLNIMPDYRKSLQECYSDTALSIIGQNKNLDIFSSPSKLFNTSDSLPSWVPTWINHTHRDKQTPYNRFQTFYSGLSENQSWFSASDHSKMLYPIPLNEQKLYLSGVIVDRIQELTDEHPFMRTSVDRDAVPNLLPFLMEQLKLLFGGFYDLGSMMDVSYQWKQMIDESSAYEDTNFIFFWIMTGGASVEDLERTYRIFMRKWWRFYVSWIMIKKFRLWWMSRISTHVYRWLLVVCWYLLRVKWPVPVDVISYRLGRTKSGRVALVPVLTEVGDELALLAGGNLVYIVRRKGSSWQFIGHSLVPGMMMG